ncbi:hypothetical protein T459_04767 [Capsicum annuum]|uniref:Uncharacterized protein n=1 Tax=Capsicum annuum TaxID=4072 RepID=A0A2G3A603_CAPAN|nr:hypothetical protein T459_04767 [Capsicum annuum]
MTSCLDEVSCSIRLLVKEDVISDSNSVFLLAVYFVRVLGSLSANRARFQRKKLYEMSATDAFERTTSTFRNIISRDPGSCFPVESGRYHLYISYVFPWASRCLAYLKIKGIDQAIDFTSVKPIWERTKDTDEHMGWVFSSSSIEEPGADPDPVNGAKT